LDLSLFPLLATAVSASTTGNETTLVDDRALKRDSWDEGEILSSVNEL